MIVRFLVLSVRSHPLRTPGFGCEAVVCVCGGNLSGIRLYGETVLVEEKGLLGVWDHGGRLDVVGDYFWGWWHFEDRIDRIDGGEVGG